MGGIRSIPVRIINHYTGGINRNSIEYWQCFIFYVIALAGVVGGTLAVVPSSIAVLGKGHYWSASAVLALYAVNVAAVFLPRIPIRTKTLVIALNFYLIGVASLVIAGPEGESGIWFSVSVLICSLFVGPRISVLVACINLLTGVAFGVLHSQGLIGWDILRGFPFGSWLIQSGNIFFMDMIFVLANTMLIRGVGNTFKTLNAAEQRITASLQEKETLIRELYHRSKNNMQVVSSLLMLHSAELREESARAIFKDVIGKIAAMSLVHQKLYESQDLSNVDMAIYIRDLAALIMKSYGVSPGRVRLDLELESLSLLLDTALPCGLVVSEIMANSLKYAFPGDRPGLITISLRSAEGDWVALFLSDDGVGLPAGFELASHAKLGMKTLFTIVKHQLQGSIDFSSGPGLAFTIRFRRKLYDERVKADE